MNHHMHHMYRCGRTTSRIFWFLAGAGTATWWHCHRDYQRWYEARHCGRDRIPREAYHPAGALPLPPSSSAGQPAEPVPGTADKWDRWGWGAWGKGSWPGQESGNPHWDRWGWGRERGASAKPEGAWGPSLPGEKASEKDVVQQATDTITELSEATLNNLLVTVESLKAKLAEHRAQREQQEREIHALREAKFRQFEEWQRQQEQHMKKDEPPRRLV